MLTIEHLLTQVCIHAQKFTTINVIVVLTYLKRCDFLEGKLVRSVDKSAIVIRFVDTSSE